jgi:hypothetical protein
MLSREVVHPVSSSQWHLAAHDGECPGRQQWRCGSQLQHGVSYDALLSALEQLAMVEACKQRSL